MSPARFAHGWMARASSLDALYNDEGQQRAGVLAALATHRAQPGFPSLCEEAGARAVNTHPVLGALVVGALEGGLESSETAQDGGALLRRAASTWAPAVASLGDRLFAGTLLPLGGAAGMLLALLIFVLHPPPLGLWLSELLWVVAGVGYFLFQGFAYRRLRARGRRGTREIVGWLQERTLERWNTRGLAVARLLSGAVAGAWIAQTGVVLGMWGALTALGTLAVFVALGRWATRRPSRSAALAVAGAWVLGTAIIVVRMLATAAAGP